MAKHHEKDKHQPTDLEVHFTAYQNLKDYYGFVRAGYEIYDRENIETAIIDILITDEQGKPKLVVEVKKNKRVKRHGKQIRKYERLTNCPCIYIIGIEDAENAVSICQKAIRSFYAED